jgi:hypothetical protein
MQASNSLSPSFLSSGQRYRVNSFDLGFVNVEPIELVVEVTLVRTAANELLLAPLPAIGEEVHGSLILIARWFQEVYPTLAPADCPLKNAQAFGRLVALGVFVAEDEPAMPIEPSSLLVSIRQPIEWTSSSMMILVGGTSIRSASF